MEEGLPKSGAQLQGAENGAAYACARGMDGEKKLLHTPPPTALPCCIYYCTTAVDRTAARLSFLPLPLIYILLHFHHHPLYNHHPHRHQHNLHHHQGHPILSSRPASRSTVVPTPEP